MIFFHCIAFGNLWVTVEAKPSEMTKNVEIRKCTRKEQENESFFLAQEGTS